MKKKCVVTTVTVLGLLAVLFVSWRMLPRSFFGDVIPTDSSAVTAFAVNARVGGLRDGVPYYDTYQIDSTNTDRVPEKQAELLDLLNSCRYRTDIRNILPWDIDSVEADKNYDNRSAVIVLSWGDGKEDCASICFLSSSRIAVRCGDAGGYSVYHPTDRDVLTRLMAYAQANGT